MWLDYIREFFFHKNFINYFQTTKDKNNKINICILTIQINKQSKANIVEAFCAPSSLPGFPASQR